MGILLYTTFTHYFVSITYKKGVIQIRNSAEGQCVGSNADST